MFLVSHRETTIREYLQIDALARWYYNYLNVSRLENAIPDNQQIEPLQFDTVRI